MKFIFGEHAKSAGVYKITNTQNGRIYIGSSGKFRTRARGHNYALSLNNHANAFLQNDWNKCGADHFVFEIIEVVSTGEQDVLTREQYYIDQNYDNQINCYNLSKDVFDTRSGIKNKNPADPATDKRCQSPSKETCAKMSESMKQAFIDDPELREISRKTAEEKWKDHSANITVTNFETKESVHITGSVLKFCKERNLDYRSFHLMVNERTKSSGGWFLGTIEPEYVDRKGEVRGPLSEEHKLKIAGAFAKENSTFIDWITGNKFVVVNFKQFAKDHNLHYGSLLKLRDKECPSVNNLIIWNEDYEKSVIDDSGKIYETVFLAAKDNNTFPWKILNVCQGSQAESKGKTYKFYDHQTKVSQEEITPISNPKMKPVRQLTLNREFVKEWPSIIDAAQSFGAENVDGNIGSVCRGTRTTAFGFKWEFSDEILRNQFIPNEKNRGSPNKRTVVKVDNFDNSVILEEYESLQEAATKNGIKSYIQILSVCSGERQQTHGMIFLYKEDWEKRVKEGTPKELKNQNSPICKICGLNNFLGLKSFATHLQFAHKITSEAYTINYLNNGIKPSCPFEGCLNPIPCVSFIFKKTCGKHNGAKS